MVITPATGMVIGGAISAIGSIFGGRKAASAAREQADMQNQAAARRLTYDQQMWEMKKQQLLSDREYAVETVKLNARNEAKRAMHMDAVNTEQYKYDLMIRNREQSSLDAQFKRSNELYANQVSLNSMTEQTAIENEYRSLQEIHSEYRFDKQEAEIENIVNEGKLRARGGSGRSVDKFAQVTMADHGRKIAMMNEALDGAGRNTQSVLKEIALDKTSADLAAFAQKMLDPGILPEPIKPFKTPMAEYQYPRQFTEADFGPQPVLGATASPSAAANAVWGATISSVAGSIGGGFSSYYGAKVK